MIVKRKLFSFIDEDGNLGYCLYNESTGKGKLFSVVEDEKMYARGVGQAVKAATQMVQSKGQGMANKAAKNLAEAGGKRGMLGTYNKTATRQVRSGFSPTSFNYKKPSNVHEIINARARSTYPGNLNLIGR